MSHLPGNPHAYNAELALDATVLSSDDSGTQTIESLLMDNAKATLALAYEQRTANLIALASINPEWYGSTSREEFAAIGARLNAGTGKEQ